MEIIIVLAVVALIAVVWAKGLIDQKKNADQEKEWPFGEKLPEGKIHVKSADVAPGKSADVAPGKSADDIVEATAPATVAETVTTVVENKPAKKPAAKKPAAKKAPAKKKST